MSYRNLVALKLLQGDYTIVAQQHDARDFKGPEDKLLRDISDDVGYRDLAGVFQRSEMMKLAQNDSAHKWLDGPAKEALYFVFILADGLESGLSD